MKPESDITYITGYSGFISCELFLIAWGAYTHTHTHMRAHAHTYAYICTEVILRNQVCAPLWPVHAWFKNGNFVNILVQKKEMHFTMGMILVTAGKISVAMDTTEELFRTDEEHR